MNSKKELGVTPSRDTNFKIFQIGFNRCGTSSFAYFFKKNGFKASHWQNGTVAASIELARREGKPLLTYVNKYQVYTDMELMDLARLSRKLLNRRPISRLLKVLDHENELQPVYAYRYFKLLDQQYPNSKFILNLRNVDKWVSSRLRFSKQRYRSCLHGDHYHPTEEELGQCWKDDWNDHVEDVKSYFADRPRDLMVFDIERDNVEKILEFFDMLSLDSHHWQRRNASTPA